jgi:hypothetical protein
VETVNPRALAQTISRDAQLVVDSGPATELDLARFARLLEGCQRVSDFGIPSDPSILAVTWRCGDEQRNAIFRFAHGKIASVFFRNRYVAYAVPAPPPPPPPPPPLSSAQLEQMRRGNEAVAMVREHFVQLGRRDQEELASLFSASASIPVSGAFGPTDLRNFYQELISDRVNQVTLRGCSAPRFDATGTVRCRLGIARTGEHDTKPPTMYRLDYTVRNGRLVGLLVSEEALQPTVRPNQSPDR